MEWTAFERLHGPILLHERLDVGFAMLNYVTAKVAGAKSVQPKDFLPQWGKQESMSPEQLRATMESMVTRADH